MVANVDRWMNEQKTGYQYRAMPEAGTKKMKRKKKEKKYPPENRKL